MGNKLYGVTFPHNESYSVHSLAGSEFLLEYKVVLDLRAVNGSFLTAGITHMRCIVAWTVEDRVRTCCSDVGRRDGRHKRDIFSEIGDFAKDQEDLRNVLLEYAGVCSPTNETLQGVEYVIQLMQTSHS